MAWKYRIANIAKMLLTTVRPDKPQVKYCKFAFCKQSQQQQQQEQQKQQRQQLRAVKFEQANFR